MVFLFIQKNVFEILGVEITKYQKSEIAIL